jgi:alanine racemase
MAELGLDQLTEYLSAEPTLGDPGQRVKRLLYDSRQLFTIDSVLFFALKGPNHNGHHYVPELSRKGVRNFCVSQMPEEILPDCNYLLVHDTTEALQNMARLIRESSKARVIGITGSNGKTTVKSWLTEILRNRFRVCSTPKSYNSQIGVPLSVWELEEHDEVGVFEAGISQPGEMLKLEQILKPEIGIFTNIGSAHDEFFKDREEKIREKLKLFRNSKYLVYQKNNSTLCNRIEEFARQQNIQLWSWSTDEPSAHLHISEWKDHGGITIGHAIYRGKKLTLKVPFRDEASLENLAHCWLMALELGMTEGEIQNVVSDLAPVAMRLEMKRGLANSTLINDAYNADLESLSIALNFQKNHSGDAQRILIITEMLQTGLSPDRLNSEMGAIINNFELSQVIGIGTRLSEEALQLKIPVELYPSTEAFLDDIFRYHFGGKSILIKGARRYRLEKIIQRLEAKTHETELRISLDRMVNNLNHFRAKLKPSTMVMAMVKAFSYGAGTVEIAKLLEFHKVDYLGVAYTDEGITLRKAGVRLPIMVLNPEVDTYDELIAYDLEPEIFNIRRLESFARAVKGSGRQEPFPIHIKLETGMNRLGFTQDELPVLVDSLRSHQELKVKSAFSHLAAADDSHQREFTLDQIKKFEEMHSELAKELGSNFMAHLCNSGGISHYPDAHYDMVRLGIGLYGIAFNVEDRRFLQPVSELYASVSQIKHIRKGDTVGYGRSFIAEQPMDIAVISIGYADGFRRSLSNGAGAVVINGQRYPVVGRVCMDMAMVDISNSHVSEGDEVEIFGSQLSIYELAEKMGTIPYEVLTGIGQRVKRVYLME